MEVRGSIKIPTEAQNMLGRLGREHILNMFENQENICFSKVKKSLFLISAITSLLLNLNPLNLNYNFLRKTIQKISQEQVQLP